ncbi:MAG TPA: membrane protein insertion efficiency factor YidD [Candidatus Binataceae bacterium]|nr:membrane protein insertion efficiency factor YidD [Candidatus Binataceae bacterium]
MNVPSKFALAMLRLYRAILSPMLMGFYGPACRFEPSCSEYAREAIEAYGVMRGSAMAARRLARCHPLGGHGHDPVPARAGRARHE